MTHEEIIRAAYDAANRKDFGALLPITPPGGRGAAGRRGSAPIRHAGPRASARRKASGVAIQADFFHLITIRDDLLYRLEAFTDRDAGLRALDGHLD